MTAPAKTSVWLVTVCLVLVALTGSAEANWNQPAPGSLNITPTGNPSGFDMTSVADTPAVVMSEENTGKLYVKELTTGGWTQLGSDVNAGGSQPRVADVGGTPYVAFQQKNGMMINQVYVKRLDGGSWSFVPGPGATSLNNDAGAGALTPTIANVGGVPYVAWKEGAPAQVYVKRFNGTTWESVGGALNVDPAKLAGNAPPFIADVGGVPYVGWTEYATTGSPPGQLFVKRLEGANWALVGTSGATPVNADATHDAFGASLADVGGAPYLQWHESSTPGQAGPYRVHVARLDGTSWTPIGVPVNSGLGAVHAVGGRPYLTVVETSGGVDLLRLLRFDGSAWVPAGDALNVDATKNAQGLRLAEAGGVPYVAVYEPDANGQQLYVKRLEPDITSEAATPTQGAATLSAQVDDFGVPLPIGFEWGSTAAFGTREPLQTSEGTGASTVTRAISGLAPSTAYFFRAFGSDTVRQTSLGSTQTFTTSAAPGPGPPPFTTSAAPGPGPPPVSNQFFFTLTNDPKDSVVATVAVPGPGSLKGKGTFKLNGKKRVYAKAVSNPARAGTFTLTMRPRKRTRKALKKSSRVRVSVAITFAPTGGASRTQNDSETVALKDNTRRLATKVDVTATTSFQIDPAAGFRQYQGDVSFTRVATAFPPDARVPNGMAKLARKECLDLFVTGTGVFRAVYIFQSRPGNRDGDRNLTTQGTTRVDGNGHWMSSAFNAEHGSTVIAKGGFWDRDFTAPHQAQAVKFKYKNGTVTAFCGAFGAFRQYP